MHLEIFKNFATTNNWYAIWPEISMACLGLLILTGSFILGEKHQKALPIIAILGQIAIFSAIVCIHSGLFSWESTYTFSGLLKHNARGQIMRLFFPFSSIFVSYIAIVYFSKQKLPKPEFYSIVTFITAAMMLLVQSNHFITLFISLETITIGFYVLVSYCRYSPFSLEAGLKYLILGAVASAILLLGIVFLYGVAGNPHLPGSTVDSMNFQELKNFLALNTGNRIAQLGVILVLCGLAFKIGAVPFQIWIPDVYQGAPTPVTAFLAVSSKAAGFMVMINLVQHPFLPMKSMLVPLISSVAITTILFGNIAATNQSNLKRLLGLSGVSHAGYLLMGIVAAFYIKWANSAIVFYLFTYLLGSFAVFGVMAHTASFRDEDQSLAHYHALAKKSPFMASILAIGVGSLAGIPPLAGFIGKLLLFIAAFKAKLYVLLGVAIIGVVISIYYYFMWIREAFFTDVGQAHTTATVTPIHIKAVHRITLALLAALTIMLGFFPGVLGEYIFYK